MHYTFKFLDREGFEPDPIEEKEQCASGPPGVEPNGVVLLAALVTRGRHMYLEGNTARDIQ